jgi:hypothetical protein
VKTSAEVSHCLPGQDLFFRAKSLEGLDNALEFFFSEQTPSYSFLQKSFHNTTPEIIDFDAAYGYFSVCHPIVSRFTEKKEDLIPVINLLERIYHSIEDMEQLELMTAEVITKALAYRNLALGMEIPIPHFTSQKEKKRTIYRVDRLFDLWHGMPAFGLIPINDGQGSPILLFRGTDFSLDTLRGWASILSDLDPKGPGYSVFQRAMPSIHDWLSKVNEEGRKARVMGFSLGGILAAYTVLYEGEHLSQSLQERSFAFNPPGLSDQIFEERRKPFNLVTIVTQEDMVSRTGNLFGKISVLSLDHPLKPLKAHVTLISTFPSFYLTRIP